MPHSPAWNWIIQPWLAIVSMVDHGA